MVFAVERYVAVYGLGGFGNEGAGASLQHYNPLIDDAVAAEWKLPASWKLISQMPVGSREAPAGEKTFEPIEKE